MRTSARRTTWPTRRRCCSPLAGVDPQPMAKTNPWYKYYTFLPKEESVDDGNLVQVGGKAYEANPFGLYSMHGNVARMDPFPTMWYRIRTQ
ncbi:MAG: hypothetical protein ACLR6J_12305 [Parabacteroides merdae]